MAMRFLAFTLCALVLAGCTRPWILDVDAGFSGIAGSSPVAVLSPAQAGMAPMRVLLIHGIGCHELNWSETLENNIARELFKDVSMSAPTIYQLAYPKPDFEKLATAQLGTEAIVTEVEFQEQPVIPTPLCKAAKESRDKPPRSPVLRLDWERFDYGFVSRRTATVSGDRVVEFISVVWSPVSESAKRALLRDDLRSCKQSDGAMESGMPNICWRASVSAGIKRVVLNDRLADAVIYLGDRQRLIHATVFRAVCFAALGNKSWLENEKLCEETLKPEKDAKSRLEGVSFAFITESLGSRITFDALVGERREGLLRALSPTTRGVYMLANQLPLIELTESELRSSLKRYKEAGDLAIANLDLAANLSDEQWLKTADANVAKVQEMVQKLLLTPRREHRVLQSKEDVSEKIKIASGWAKEKGSVEQTRQLKHSTLALATDAANKSLNRLESTKQQLKKQVAAAEDKRDQIASATSTTLATFTQVTGELVSSGAVTCGQVQFQGLSLPSALEGAPHKAVLTSLADIVEKLEERIEDIDDVSEADQLKVALAGVRSAEQSFQRIVQARSTILGLEGRARQSAEAAAGGICSFANGPQDLAKADKLAGHVRESQRYTVSVAAELQSVFAASHDFDKRWQTWRNSKSVKKICGWFGECSAQTVDDALTDSSMLKQIQAAATSDLGRIVPWRDKATRTATAIAKAYEPDRQHVAELTRQVAVLRDDIKELEVLEKQQSGVVDSELKARAAADDDLKRTDKQLNDVSTKLVTSENERDAATARLEEERRKADEAVLNGFGGVAILLHSRSIAREFQIEYLETQSASPRAQPLLMALQEKDKADRFQLFPIVAFSDPNDLLSYPIGSTFSGRYLGSPFVNVTLRAGDEYLWMAGHPVEAHTGHLKNPLVAKLIAKGCSGRISRTETRNRRAVCEAWQSKNTGSTSNAGSTAPATEVTRSPADQPTEAVTPQTIQ